MKTTLKILILLMSLNSFADSCLEYYQALEHDEALLIECEREAREDFTRKVIENPDIPHKDNSLSVKEFPKEFTSTALRVSDFQ